MTRRPHAHLYGTDGFDPDVSANLHSFYRVLGYLTYAVTKLGRGSLLVVQRPGDRGIDASAYEQVHVYDYIGRDIGGTLESLLSHPDVQIFTSCQARGVDLEKRFPVFSGRIHVQLPPVDISLWTSPSMPAVKEYPLVHVGNYKPYYAEGVDTYATVLFELARMGRLSIWGRGWDDVNAPQSAVKGRIRLKKVSEVYRHSGLAIGMMYPFQREVTISGRFWQAPLNGCLVMSEPSLYADGLPGVASFETVTDVLALANNTDRPSSVAIAREASAFWRQCWDDSLRLVRSLVPTSAAARSTSLRPGSSRLIARTFDRARRLRHGVF